jgi:hypothetical protein
VFLLLAGFGLLTGGGAGKLFGFPFPLIIVGFGAAAGIAAAVFLSWARRMMAQAHEAARAAYENFARKVGGQRRGHDVHGPSQATELMEEIVFSCDGQPARLVLREERPTSWAQSDEARRSFTEVIVELRRPTGFRCQVKPRPFLKRHGATSDLPQVELGFPLFDDHYVVRANDEARAKSVIPGEAQNELLSLRQWLRSNVDGAAGGDIELSIEDGALRLSVGWPLVTEESLDRLVGAGTFLLECANGALRSTGG